MSTPPLVSVCIPAHNAAPWIRQCVKSVCAQTYPRTEILIVDDGSTDKTYIRAANAVWRDRRYRIIHSDDAYGASSARNRALQEARGQYIQWLDADDILHPDKIAEQMKIATDPTVLLSGSCARFFARPQRSTPYRSELEESCTPGEFLRRKLQHNAAMQTGTWLTSRELCLAAGPWNEDLTTDDDGEYYCRVLALASRVQYVPEALVYYRKSLGGSLSHVTATHHRMDSQWASMIVHMQTLIALNGDTPETCTAIGAYLNTWASIFAIDRPDLVENCRGIAREFDVPFRVQPFTTKFGWLAPYLGQKTTLTVQRECQQLRRTGEAFVDYCYAFAGV